MTPIKHASLVASRRVFVIGVVVALVMSVGTQTTMAQDGRRRAGAAERIGLESLGAGLGLLGAGLIGVLTGLATSPGRRSAGYDFSVDFGYPIGVHLSLGIGLILAPIVATFGAQADQTTRVSWLYGLLGAVVLGGSGYAIAFAAEDEFFQPSAWVLAPVVGILLGTVLGLELGVAVAPEADDDDPPERSTLQLTPSVQLGQGAVLLGIDGRF